MGLFSQAKWGEKKSVKHVVESVARTRDEKSARG